MDVLDVLLPLTTRILPRGQMAIGDRYIRRINLHEQHNGPFVAQIVLEASFNL